MFKVNLLRWRSLERSRQFKQLLLQVLFAVLCALVTLIVVNQTLHQQVEQQRSKLQHSETALDKIKLLPKKQQDVANDLTIYQQHYHKISEVIQQHQHTQALFELLDDLVPIQVTLTQLTFHKDSLKLTGISYSNSALSSFLSELSKLDVFKSPVLSVSLHSPVDKKENTKKSIKQFELQVRFLSSHQLNNLNPKV